MRAYAGLTPSVAETELLLANCAIGSRFAHSSCSSV
jgi:hypothetical protein